MRQLWGFPIMMFVKTVIYPTIKITVLSAILPALLYFKLEDTLFKSILVMLVSFLSGVSTVYFLGLEKQEKVFVKNKIASLNNKIVIFISTHILNK